MRGKRIKQFILILCMVCLFGMNVQAEDVYTEFHVDNQKGEFNTGQEVGGFQISIYYDKEVLEFQSLEAGDLIEKAGGGIFDYNHIEESSEIIVVYVVPDTVKNEGSIVDLKFKLKKDCTEKLPIGMKPDEVVDNTESSNPITGEVSGVDKEFQEKVVTINRTKNQIRIKTSQNLKRNQAMIKKIRPNQVRKGKVTAGKKMLIRRIKIRNRKNYQLKILKRWLHFSEL